MRNFIEVLVVAFIIILLIQMCEVFFNRMEHDFAVKHDLDLAETVINKEQPDFFPVTLGAGGGQCHGGECFPINVDLVRDETNGRVFPQIRRFK